MLPTILIATTNAGKRHEVRAVLGDLPVRFATLDDFEDLPPAIEDADTFAGNAACKALYYARLTACLSLADDSGLEVDVLGGAPGVRSARYAGAAGDDAANNAKLIAELAAVPVEQWTARFRCALALANGERVVATATGSVEGLIVSQAVGSNGFGYDPHFFLPNLGVTAAQLSVEEKNRISHRGQALSAIRAQIEELLPPMDKR